MTTSSSDINYVLIAVCTLDGKIAYHERHFTDWASKEDQLHFKSYLENSEVLIVGNNTYKTALHHLKARNCIVFTSSIEGIEKRNSLCTYINPARNDVHLLLQEEKYTRATVLGGAQTYSWALKHDYPTEILLTLEPIVFGKGISFFETAEPLLSRCTLISSQQLNEKGTLLLHYKLENE